MKKAFTLIELLIVIAIISILTGIAYPSYIHSIQKTYRDTAKITLMKIANALESYYGSYHNYANAENSISFAKSDRHYNYRIEQASNEHYLITASPIKKDKVCGVLKINDSGARSYSGNAKALSCW